MSLQYITDAKGVNTAVLIPIQEWEMLNYVDKDGKE